MSEKQTTPISDNRALENTLATYSTSFVTHITLPSRARLYQDELAEKDKGWDGSLTITPWTGFHEKTLTAARGNFSELLDDMLKTCVHECPLPLSRLLVIDRVALLIQVRALSLGEKYTIKMQCPACKGPVRKTVNLYEDIDIKYLEDDTIVEEPMVVELPNCKVRVFFRMLRGEDERSIASWSETWRRKHQEDHTDEGYLYRLSKHVITMEVPTEKGVITLNNPDDDSMIRKVFDKMLMRDTSAFRKAISSVDFGYDLDLSCVCPDPECKTDIPLVLTITPEFFRPSEEQDQ